MDLPRDGVVYATVTFVAYPTGAAVAEASVDRVNWHPFDVPPAPGPAGQWVGKVLLRGPNASSTNGLLVPGPTAILWARISEAPEIIPVQAGKIVLV